MNLMLKVVLENTGYVELLDRMGGDLAVVNAARVSYAKESFAMGQANERLIRFLMREGHGSPFEHSIFQFRVKAPLFVVAQWERHRMASYNQQSGRYTEFQYEVYAPELEIADAAKYSYDCYKAMLDRGVPKERARICLPVGQYTTFRTTINARSLMNFISQRNSEHAQDEMRQYARAVENIFASEMPVTWSSFIDHGRKSV